MANVLKMVRNLSAGGMMATDIRYFFLTGAHCGHQG